MTRWACCGVMLLACTPKEEPGDTGDTDTGELPEDTGDPLPQDADQDGFSAEQDCDDEDATVFPGAPDLCGDDRVTDCDRSSDEGLVTLDSAQGFDDLQQALWSAVEGSVLLLCPGVHTGSFEVDVAVTLFVHGAPGDVTLSGGGAGPVLQVPGGSALHGLVLRDGEGGGLIMTSPGSLYLEDCRLQDNHALSGGGLALAEDSTATLIRTAVTNNAAQENGGGVSVPAGSTLDLSDESAVQGNRAQQLGGGIWLVDAELVGGMVSDNLAEGSEAPTGGGVAAEGLCSVTATSLWGNESGYGGGLALRQGDLTLTDVLIHDNLARQGGGLSVTDGTVQMLGSTEVFSNLAEYGGGGLLVSSTLVGGLLYSNEAGDDGGGLFLQNATVDSAILEFNSASSGGGAFVSSPSTLLSVMVLGNEVNNSGGGIAVAAEPAEEGVTRIEGGEISNNDAEIGGGLYASLVVEVIGTDLVDNDALVGGAVYASDYEIRLESLSVLRNTAPQGGGVWIGGAEIGGAVLTAVDVDFGTGGDDNSGDVVAGNGVYESYGADTSIQCDYTGCVDL